MQKFLRIFWLGIVIAALPFLCGGAIAGEVEFSIGSYLRTRSLSGGLITHLTHRYALWGQKGDIIRGFLQSSLTAQTIVISTLIEPSVEIYPVSFLGFGVGSGWTRRTNKSFEIKGCGALINCGGTFTWPHLMATLQTAFWGFFFQGVYKAGDATASKTSLPFLEPSAFLIFPPKGTRLERLRVTAGYNVNGTLSLGALGVRNSAPKLKESTDFALLFIKILDGSWSYLAGLGTFSSPTFETYGSRSTKKTAPTVLVDIRYSSHFNW